MLKKPLFQSIFWLLVLIGLTHYLSLHFAWYWVFWWLDVMMHFLGGLWVGLIMVLLVESLEQCTRFRYSHLGMFFMVVGGVMVVGLLWEAFEVYAGLFVVDRRFPDTYHDLWMDLAGGLTAFTYVFSKNYFHNDNIT